MSNRCAAKSGVAAQFDAGATTIEARLPTPQVDRLARLAARLLQAPCALVLLEVPDLHIIGRYGELLTDRSGSWIASLAAELYPHTHTHPTPLVLPSLRAMSVAAWLRPQADSALLAVPFMVSGCRGAVYVVDTQARTWADADARVLQEIATTIALELESDAPATRFDRASESIGSNQSIGVQQLVHVIDHQPALNTLHLRAAVQPVRDALPDRPPMDQQRSVFADADWLTQVIAFAPIIAFTLDCNGVITNWIGPTTAFGGSAAHDLIGSSAFDLVQQPVAQAYLVRAMRGEALCATLQIDPYTFDAYVRPIHDAQDQLVGSAGLLIDVSSHQQLIDEHAHLAAILEETSDIVVQMDAAGRVCACNRAGRAFFGWRADEDLAQYTFADLYASSTAEAREATVARALYDGVATNEGALIGADDQTLPVAQVLVANQTGHVQSRGVTLIARDMTAWKQAEEAIRHQEAYFQSVIENTLDVIMVLDAYGIIQYASPSVEVLGYMPQELLGSNLLHYIHPDDCQLVTDRITHIAQYPGVPTFAEYRFRHKSNVWCVLEGTGKTHQAADGQLRIVLNSRDVTTRNLMEQALAEERALLNQRIMERTHELEAANQALARAARLKDEFLANMSHELRTPLNAVIGFTEALQEHVYGDLNARQSMALQSIEESGRHLLTLINDILDLSKIEAGKLKLECSMVQIQSVCQASVRLIKPSAQQKQLRITTTFDDAVTTLYADERRLKQMLVNLLSNAVKFTPDGGTIGLEVIGDQATQQVHFRVSDTGIGIAADDLDRLFQPFVQLDSRLSRRYNGTGLGLSLVLRMAQMHNGHVSVESEVGKGSVFTVSLPWRIHHPATLRAPAPSDQMVIEHAHGSFTEATTSTNAPLILLAEDSPQSCVMLTDYLQSKGYKVVTAQNGCEAITQAQTVQPHVIMMDINMPGLDGLAAIAHIRRDPRLAAVPIIALTALAMAGDRERCLAAGANDYISKPASLKQLAAAIETQLRQQTARS